MSLFSQTISVAANACYWLSDLSAFVTNSIHCGKAYNGIGGVPFNGAARFTSVTVAKNAAISSAILTIKCSLSTGAEITRIYAHANDSSAQIASASAGQTIINSYLTTAYVNPGNFDEGASYNIDVTSIVNEIITRASWASGNNLQFMFKDNGSGDGVYWRNSDVIGTYAPISLNIIAAAAALPQIMIF